MIITICGSVKNTGHIKSIRDELMLDGHNVLCPELSMGIGEPKPETIRSLSLLHLLKINMADRVAVVLRHDVHNMDNNIAREILYAISRDKHVDYYRPVDNEGTFIKEDSFIW